MPCLVATAMRHREFAIALADAGQRRRQVGKLMRHEVDDVAFALNPPADDRG